MTGRVGVYGGEAIGAYGYEEKPWFAPHVRLDAFERGLRARGLDRQVSQLDAPPADDATLLLFHTAAHVERVRRLSATNAGALDHGPTLARASVERAATHVVGAVVDAARRILEGDLARAFVPIAGFHHAHAEAAREYCLYNDCAVVLRYLGARGVAPVAYVDVDAHFGDGVHAAFEADPGVVLADLHEDGSTLWPHSPERPGAGPFPGRRLAEGEGHGPRTRLTLPLPAGATDAEFHRAWAEAEAFVAAARPGFVVLVSGADGLAGDPLAHLAFSPAVLGHAARRLRAIAEEHAGGRLLVLGGGGYDVANLVAGWSAVVEALVEP